MATKETTAPSFKYEARDGQIITLTFDTIRRYLVQGHPEFVTPQELMYFCGVCKSKGMNPFKKDCYLIKYTQKDGAAIVTAIDFLRSRAKAMPDCRGWKAGIVLRRNGQLEYREGTLILDDEELVGGWFQGKPAGWDEPIRWTVPLKSYIKKTKDGEITRFWQKENQPTQIAKVAESQGLRKCWPDEFEHIYTDAEISPDDTVKPLAQIPEETAEKNEADPDALEKFDEAVPEGADMEKLKAYLELAAKQSKITIYEVKQAALEQWDSFWAAFGKWQGKWKKTETEVSIEEKKEPKKEPLPSAKKKGSFDQNDPIRKEYIKLNAADFENWIKAHLAYIPNLDEVYQRDIRATWERRFPGKAYPLDVTDEPTEEELPGETDEQKILRLVDGAELDESLGKPMIIVTCPDRDEDKPSARWCNNGNCKSRKGCPTWEAYDAE